MSEGGGLSGSGSGSYESLKLARSFIQINHWTSVRIGIWSCSSNNERYLASAVMRKILLQFKKKREKEKRKENRANKKLILCGREREWNSEGSNWVILVRSSAGRSVRIDGSGSSPFFCSWSVSVRFDLASSWTISSPQPVIAKFVSNNSYRLRFIEQASDRARQAGKLANPIDTNNLAVHHSSKMYISIYWLIDWLPP